MQSSSRSRPFKPTLAGASPATDAKCSQGVINSARRSAKAEARGANPRESTNFEWRMKIAESNAAGPMSGLSILHSAFCISCDGGHDVKAASRPVTAFVPVRTRLVTPISMNGNRMEFLL
jgi:hypothetical protein